MRSVPSRVRLRSTDNRTWCGDVPLPVHPGGAREPDLGGEHHVVAHGCDEPPEDRLRAAVGVDVGAVEQVDAGVEAGSDDAAPRPRRCRRRTASCRARAARPGPRCRRASGTSWPGPGLPVRLLVTTRARIAWLGRGVGHRPFAHCAGNDSRPSAAWRSNTTIIGDPLSSSCRHHPICVTDHRDYRGVLSRDMGDTYVAGHG